MPNGFESPDELISELQAIAAEFEPFDAIAFATEARDELAAYREQRQLESIQDRAEFPEGKGRFPLRKPAIAVPEQYQSQAEFFVVFALFVRFFIDPIVVAGTIPSVILQAANEPQINALGFQRFGEEVIRATPVAQLRTLLDDARELTEIAGTLGQTIFGNRFRKADFWES